MKVLPYSRVTLDSPLPSTQALARLQEATTPRRRLEIFHSSVTADRFSLKVWGPRAAAVVSGRVQTTPEGSRVEAVVRPSGPVIFFFLFWWPPVLLWLRDELRTLYLTGGMNRWVLLFVVVGALYSALCVGAWRREEREARRLLVRVFQDGRVYFDRY